tara:strand:- start:2637 stop:4202 length:1566 start_codon:yes stop_codon:yes gene_type:complete
MRIIKIPLMVMLITFKLSSQKMHDARNAMHLSVKDSIVHLYKVNDYDASNAYIYFLYHQLKSPKTLEARDEENTLLWSREIRDNALSITGGFDFNEDGWPDLATVVRGEQIYDKNGQLLRCGSGGKNSRQLIKTSFLVLYNGRTGHEHRVVSPLKDYCFPNTNDSTSYIVRRYYDNSIIFGKNSRTIVISPDYNPQQWFFTFNGTTFQSESLVFHSSPQFEEYYKHTNQYWGLSYKANLNGINGLLVENGTRYVLFSYGRLLHYEVGPYRKEQLLWDAHDFRNHIEEDRYAYRTKGKVQVDSAYPQNVALIGGTNSLTFFWDNINGVRKSDPYGGLHRRFLIHNTLDLSYEDRFFSQTDATHQEGQYNGRIIYPSNVFLTIQKGSPSRVMYNVYENNKWYLHISKPNVTEDESILDNQFVWDIRDIDGDEVEEIIVSPTNPQKPYFVQNLTNIYHWDENRLQLDSIKTVQGIPNLSSRFPSTTTRDSRGYLSPAQIIVVQGKSHIAMYDLITKTIQIEEYE